VHADLAGDADDAQLRVGELLLNVLQGPGDRKRSTKDRLGACG
jgi:hypothetical protein